jgi:hypothetical protein
MLGQDYILVASTPYPPFYYDQPIIAPDGSLVYPFL